MPKEQNGFFGQLKKGASTTNKGPRRTAKTYETGIQRVELVDFDASYEKATEALNADIAQIQRNLDKALGQLRKRSLTKAALTEKVRGEIASGKLPKGTLKKTVEQRWKRSKQRHARRVKQLNDKAAAEITEARNKHFPEGVPAESHTVFQPGYHYTVEADVDISEDTRTISLSFEANAGDDLEAQVFLAASEYFQDDRIDLTDFTVTARESL